MAENFGLKLSTPINSVPTQYTDNFQGSNSVLDLIFLRTGSEEFNNYIILPDLQSLSGYTSLLVSMIMKKEFIWKKK